MDDALLRLLATGVAALGHGAQCGAGQRAGGLEVDLGIGAEGVLSRLAVAAVAHRPGSRAGRLHDQIKAGHVRVGYFLAMRQWLDGCDGAGGEHRVSCACVTGRYPGCKPRTFGTGLDRFSGNARVTP